VKELRSEGIEECLNPEQITEEWQEVEKNIEPRRGDRVIEGS